MVFHVFSYTIRIERTPASLADELARHRQEQLLKAREEADSVQAAQLGLWV